MKRTLAKWMSMAILAFAGIGLSALSPTGAVAATVTTITCAPYLPNTNSYPRDQAGHAQLCTRKVVVDGGTPTFTVPSTSRANTLFGTISGAYAGSIVLPANVKSRLETYNVKYFFFNNRADGDLYFSGVAPYSGGMGGVINPPRAFVGAGGRCANTGYGYTLLGQLYIAVAVYNTCNLDTLGVPPITNPSLEKTVLHETGHAFDDTFSTFGDQAGVASKRAGFNQLRIADVNALTTPKPGTPPATWSGMDALARDKHVCTLFYAGNQPSQIERDLGASASGGPQGQVCTLSSPSARYSFWVAPGAPASDYTPHQIAVNKLPYFVNNNQEVWAELFVTEIYGTYGPAAFTQFTDGVLNNDAIATATPGYKRAFDCTRNVVKTYITTLAPPPLNATGCVTSGPL